MISMPQPSKSPVFRVARAAPRARAMAAIWQSNWLIGRPAARLAAPMPAYSAAAALSKGSIRSRKSSRSMPETASASVTPAAARRVAQAHARWGKGLHPASLNFGDCFAYALAAEHGCPLLYVGGDFAQTDIRPAL